MRKLAGGDTNAIAFVYTISSFILLRNKQMATLPSTTYANPTTPYFAAAGAAPAPAASPFVQGMIMMWDKTASFPPGWFICDGAVHNGYTTPTLLDKFVLSLGPSNPTVGLGGGQASVSLVVNNLPDHQHSGAATQGSGGTAGINDYNTASFTGTTGGISSVGYVTPGGTPFSVLPPYVSYAYICYCGIAP
jgi:hypothetical protein